MKITSRYTGPLRSLPFAALAAFLTLTAPASRLIAGPNGNGQIKPAFSGITVIGDSLSDTGRTFQAIGIPPAPYYNGRVSNGPVWIEYLANQLGLTYNPLDNFSWAGSHSGRLNSFPGLPGMLDQRDELLSLEKRLDNKALYVVFGGSNDFLRIFGGGENPLVVIPGAVANIVSIVRDLQSAGAKHIVVVDLPNIGLTPRARALGAGPIATSLSVLYNELLDAALAALPRKLIRVSAFDILNTLAANPAAYGFTNIEGQGIMNLPAADTYLYWDDLHPTTRAHRYVSTVVFEAIAAAGLLKKSPELVFD